METSDIIAVAAAVVATVLFAIMWAKTNKKTKTTPTIKAGGTGDGPVSNKDIPVK